MSRVFRISLATAIAAVMASATAAQAQVTIGQLAPGNPPTPVCTASQFDLAPFGVGSAYEVPDTGVITSWSTNAAAGANQILTFKVFRRIIAAVYLVVGHDTRTLKPGVVNTFKTDIPVQSGDVIGLNSGNASPTLLNACLTFTGRASDSISAWTEDVPDQGLTNEEHLIDQAGRLNVSATVLAPPAIEIGGRVDLGSITGGANVVLSGFNFSEVSRVSFGGVPAPHFTVDSERQITAVAPAGRALDGVSAVVTTPAGSAETASVFSYRGCLVPKLTGRKLAAAKTSIKGAGCKLGKVKRVKGRPAKAGRILKQTPKPGNMLAPESKVSVKIGR